MVWLSLGRVGRPFGVHGAFVVHWFADLDELTHAPKVLRLSHPDGRSLISKVRDLKPHARGSRVALDDIDSPELAKTWCHAEVALDRALLAPTDADEYYLVDLMGLDACDEAHAPLGRIVGLYDHGSTPLLAIVAGSGDEKLLPMLDETLRHVDRAAGQVTLRVPEGLW